MATKAKTPAPIDRPLSRAYLREFSGWSTAYPPGLSDPASLRIMENVQINKDGSCRIRPGLRYLSFEESPTDEFPGVAIGETPVGTHEAFFLNDGTKAYLFASRDNTDQTVKFWVLRPNTDGPVIQNLTSPGIDFDIPQGEDVLNFSPATTYVKYLQVDNKIFALSDAGESMRLFNVGDQKSARKILSIERPDWSVADKLTVVHPNSDWITSGEPLSVRTNLLKNPGFTSLLDWFPSASTSVELVTSEHHDGTTSYKVGTLPTRTNLMTAPLHNVALYGMDGWTETSVDATIQPSASYLNINSGTGSVGRIRYCSTVGSLTGVVAGQNYKVAADVGPVSDDATARFLVRFYSSTGAQVGSDWVSNAAESARFTSPVIKAPTGAVKMRVYLGVRVDVTAAKSANFKNVVVVKSDESTAVFSGDSGIGYRWTGLENFSSSVYHPTRSAQLSSDKVPVGALASVVSAFWLKAAQTDLDGYVGIRWFNSDGVELTVSLSPGFTVHDSGWARKSLIDTAPATATHAMAVAYFPSVPYNEFCYVDSALLELDTTLKDFFDGSTPSVPDLAHAWTGIANFSSSTETAYSADSSIPPAETPTADTLISTGVADHENDYNFGFFYCFTNEVGDSAFSQVTIVKAQRAWGAWRWETPNAAGEPSGTETSDPYAAADQLVAYMPEDVFDQAVAMRAVSWSLYAMTWSNQDAVPIEAVKVAERDLASDPVYQTDGWAVMTPQSSLFDDTAIIPSENSIYNYSNPSHGGNGIVAADRMVMVKDPTDLAVIRWSSNQQGNYTDFTASRGGGYKTLTSGNLFIPAAVKLWQNPQSVDTLTILCVGVDGHSTGYYMAPASVTSQSDSTAIMGFEETTATPGTTSPYGCEVVNNSLYHPLDDQLMKSTASNYNINHKPQTEQIQNFWSQLRDKDQIVSSVLDTCIYYIVHNPDGAPLLEGCNGNELWVYDTAAETGTWSRFLIQGVALRKIEFGGLVYMSVVCNDGIYYLDPAADSDHYVNEGLEVVERYIPWRIETNTQGANRAHDAWARLQLLQISLGNFQGSMKWGIRSWDVNGQPVDKNKTYRDLNDPDLVNKLPFDIDDSLQIQRDLQQWFFYASSIEELVDEELVTARSYGQINNLQYRYAPVSVNVGYESGSIETFEYERATVNWDSRTTDAGIAQPMTDVRRP